MFVFGFIVFMKCQYPSLNFAAAFDGNAICTVWGSTNDSNGNSYAAGTFNYIVDFDYSSSVYTISAGTAGMRDVFLTKYSKTGQFLWAFSLASPGDESCRDIEMDKNDNVLVTGGFYNTVDFDPSASTANLTSNGGGNVFVAKYTSNGQYLWAFAIGSTFGDVGYAIISDNLNNIWVTGITYGVADFDPSASTATLAAGGFLAKCDQNGNYLWAGNVPLAEDLDCDKFNNVICVGNFVGTKDFDPSASTATLACNGGGSQTDLFVAKYNSAGQYQFAFNIGGTNSDLVYEVAVDKMKEIYITGNLGNGVVDFDPSASTATVNTAVNPGYIAKYDSLGNYLWAFCTGDMYSSSGSEAICVDALSNAYITGGFNGTVDFDPSSASYTLSGNGAYIAKYDMTGQFQWAFPIKTSLSNSEGRGISVDDSSNVYLGCIFKGVADFEPYPPVKNYTAIGAAGGVAKYSCFNPSQPVNTTSLNLTVCSLDQATLSATANGGINWYSSSTSTLILGTGYNFVTPTLSVGSYTYFAESQICTANPNRTAVSFNVIASPTLSIAGTNTVCSGQNINLTGSGASTYTWSTSSNSNSIVVSPTINTTYSVMGTAPNGCQNTATFSVAVLSPTLSLFGGSTICSGSSITQTVTGANSYSWSSGSTNSVVVLTPTVTSSYTVTGTDGNGCTASLIKTITVNSLPTLTINGFNSACIGSTLTEVVTGAQTYTWNTGSNSPTISITPTITTNYTVSGTDINGCSNTIVKTITVNALPSMTISGSNSVCIGSAISQTISGASNYTWSSGQTTSTVILTPTITTTYTVLGVDVNTCTNSISKSITVNQLPIVNANSSNSVICGPPYQQTATLTATGATTYTWSTSTNGSIVAISPSVTTSYTVTGTDNNGCTNTFVITQSVSTCANISELPTPNSELKIFPNPNNGEFTISLNKISNNTYAEIYNCLGQVVIRKPLAEANTKINLSEQANGIYFVRIVDENSSITIKLIKE